MVFMIEFKACGVAFVNMSIGLPLELVKIEDLPMMSTVNTVTVVNTIDELARINSDPKANISQAFPYNPSAASGARKPGVLGGPLLS